MDKDRIMKHALHELRSALKEKRLWLLGETRSHLWTGQTSHTNRMKL